MTDIFISSDNILTPIGLTTAENISQLKQNISGVKLHDDNSMSEQPFYASLFDNEDFFTNNHSKNNYTRFEKLLIASISDALSNSSIDTKGKNTVLIISTTKGNISLLETEAASTLLNERI